MYFEIYKIMAKCISLNEAINEYITDEVWPQNSAIINWTNEIKYNVNNMTDLQKSFHFFYRIYWGEEYIHIFENFYKSRKFLKGVIIEVF